MFIKLTTALPLLVLAALAAACSKLPEEHKDLRSPFQIMVERIVGEPPCSTEIPMEWSPSLPVPVLAGTTLHYRVFFSGWSGRPDTKIVLYDAQGDAEFGTDGVIYSCTSRDGERKALPDHPFPFKTQDEFDARARTLYASIEEMGRLYARGMPVLDADRTRVRDFSREFALLGGSGSPASYRALSPGFWAWVEKNGGSAPAPAK